MKKTAKAWKQIYSSLDFKADYTYTGKDLGAVCRDDSTSFKVWSPMADRVVLNFYKAGNEEPAFASQEMKKGEKGVWEFEVAGNLHGIYYDYTLEIDGESILSADPYAKASGVNGLRSMAVDLSLTDPEGWDEDKAPEKGPETIIYELHVKEFSWDKSGGFPEETRGKYTAFCHADTTLNNDGVHPTGLPYLKELGVSHVQLMPVYDYGSVDEAGADDQFNWGYDPVNYNVPEGSYSSDPFHGEVRIRELKEAVQSLHKQGFRVIMDVVYNHTYSFDSCLQKTAPWYYYRTDENGTPSIGSACGNDVASERAMCSKYILDSVLYWIEEYHMDGFRFDLMGLLDTELMNQIRKELDARYGKGEKILFGEPWAANPTAMDKGYVQALKCNMNHLDENIGMFCDDTRDGIKGSALEIKEPGFVNGAPDYEDKILNSVSAWRTGEDSIIKAPSQVLSYVSSHDNQTLWDKLGETVEDETLRRKMYRLAAGIYMTCQGNLFFLSGEEFVRTKNGCEDSYNAPISLNRLDWAKAWEEKEMVDYYKGLIALRKQLPGLTDKSKDAWKRIRGQWKKEGLVGFQVDNSSKEQESQWETLYIIYNRNQEPVKAEIPAGKWEVLADSRNSLLWVKPEIISGTAQVEAVSMLVLGKGRK